MTEIKFGWRNLNKKFYFIQDKRDGIIKDYNWENYSVSDSKEVGRHKHLYFNGRSGHFFLRT